jgi:hypothetical protein
MYSVVLFIILFILIRRVGKPLYFFLIGSPWIIFSWLSIVLEHILWIQLVSASSITLFFGYAAYLIFQLIKSDEQVTAGTLFGASCIYMLLGLTWTGVYTLVELADSHSFQIASDPTYRISRVSELIYNSFTTLTTLGYGDISPRTPMAQSLAILEATTGVLFMALIIGMLVGIYSSAANPVQQGNSRCYVDETASEMVRYIDGTITVFKGRDG